MTAGPLLAYEIAKPFLPGIENGTLKLVGAVIKNVSSGHIVAHVQPTQALQSAVGLASGLNSLNLVASGVTVGQNEAMRRKLNVIQSSIGNLQLTQFATLGVSLVGVGVTVAATALILSRIRSVEAKVVEIGQKVDTVKKLIEDEPVRSVLVDLRTSLQRIDELDH